MTTRARAVHLAAIVAVLVSVLTLASPVAPPAVADTCEGVWVVVDARAAGGSLSTRCASGSPATGLTALERAGHAYAFVPRIPGMVCTIDARPDPCNGAPASAYWSYWYAEPGGSWTYATVGAGARTPPPGSVEGWRLGDGSAPPGTAPPANRPPPAEPADDPDDDGGAAATGSSGGASRSGSGDGGGGSGGGGAGSATTGSANTEPSAPARDPGDPGPAATAGDEGAPDEATTPTDDSSGEVGDEEAGRAPSWRPDPVATGQWENPPADDTPLPDAADEQHEATGPAAEDEPTTALASHRSDGDDPLPVSGAVGLGLLAGIGVLTWRQRLRRTGPTS